MHSPNFRFPIFLAVILLLGLTIACTNTNALAANQTDTGTVIQPKAGPGIVLSNPINTKELVEKEFGAALRVPLDSGMTLSYTLDANLDVDSDLEQIVLARKQDDGEDIVHILIADKPEANSPWKITWETPLKAGLLPTIAMNIQDVTGKHDPCIVLSGSASDGTPTLNILLPDRKSPILTCLNILSINSDIEILIETTPRPIAYEDGVSPALPYIVSATNRDNSKPNSMDMVKASYRYLDEKQQYELFATQIVSNSIARVTQLTQVFREDTTKVEQFISGAWSRNQNNANQTIYFDPMERNILMVESDRLESHRWSVSQKSPSLPRLQMHLTNELLLTIQSIMVVTFNNPDEIIVTIQNRPEWTGIFSRLKIEEASRLQQNKQVHIKMNSTALAGLYTGDDQLELIFNNQDFRYRHDGSEETGTYITFSLRDAVIATLGFKDKQGRIIRSANYRITFEENVDGQRLQRKLTMAPVYLLASRLVDTGGETLRLIQSKTIE